MPKIEADIPENVWKLLQTRTINDRRSVDQVIAEALTAYFNAQAGTLFQVSTSGALVEGIYRGAVPLRTLREHGDLGLGTFENLDGELILVDGHFFQARPDGSVVEVDGQIMTPFAVVTKFRPSHSTTIEADIDLSQIQHEFDKMRDSENLFYALRITGRFARLHLRAMCKTTPGVRLIDAAATQPEFKFEEIEGTMVGFWSPELAKSLNVPGYHLHFLSVEHQKGGHVLGCSGRNLRLELQREISFSVVLPGTEEFLNADLTDDPSADLNAAENARPES